MWPATLVPVSEYLSTDYSPDCDYIDGELEERNVGAKDHGNVQKRLLLYLSSRERQLGIFVIQVQRVQLSPTPTPDRRGSLGRGGMSLFPQRRGEACLALRPMA